MTIEEQKRYSDVVASMFRDIVDYITESIRIDVVINIRFTLYFRYYNMILLEHFEDSGVHFVISDDIADYEYYIDDSMKFVNDIGDIVDE